MEIKIRKMDPSEYELLSDFLYEAIFQRDENNLLPREIIQEPALRIYIEDFGEKKHDQKTGFSIIDENEEEYIMMIDLKENE